LPSPKSYKVILGVTGGIAAYKACELLRLFKKAGHQVRVVMTAHAEGFVGAITFQSLSGEPVLRSLQEGVSDLSATSHIDLAQWGDVLVVAPATANFLAKFSYGAADDALLTEALAFQGPVVVAPAMNTRMWNAEVTLENVDRLLSRGVRVVGPESGDLACGEVGTGKMSEPEEIFAASLAILEKGQPLKGKKVLVTSGPTRANIDSVRFLTNRSSGKMGHAVALAAELLGAEVTLVTGPVEERYARLRRGRVVKVETGAEMLAACEPVMPSVQAIFAAAAVADFEMPEVLPGKVKREGTLELKLKSAVDVLAKLGQVKKNGQVFFGFAAEAGAGEEAYTKARAKMEKKNLDFLALNDISRKDIGFDADQNEIHLFTRGEEAVAIWQKAGKFSLAERLVKKAFHL
jgi:phosphopantothenoylcysteine decarboxylase/phosphopantothenate--cysteine ligase